MSKAFGSDENRMAASQAPGFWLVASVMTDCDQTIASLLESARFYPGSIPEALRSALNGAIDHRGEAEPIEALSALFNADSIAQMRDELPHCPYVERYAGQSQREPANNWLGWLMFEPQTPGPYWGALEFFCMDSELLPTPPPSEDGESEDPPMACRLPEEQQALFKRAALSYCESTLDALERSLNLEPAIIRLSDDSESAFELSSPIQERARWSEDWIPCCMKPEHELKALALLERDALDRNANPPHPLAQPRRSSV